jgi:hypothetical protein
LGEQLLYQWMIIKNLAYLNIEILYIKKLIKEKNNKEKSGTQNLLIKWGISCKNLIMDYLKIKSCNKKMIPKVKENSNLK